VLATLRLGYAIGQLLRPRVVVVRARDVVVALEKPDIIERSSRTPAPEDHLAFEALDAAHLHRRVAFARLGPTGLEIRVRLDRSVPSPAADRCESQDDVPRRGRPGLPAAVDLVLMELVSRRHH